MENQKEVAEPANQTYYAIFTIAGTPLNHHIYAPNDLSAVSLCLIEAIYAIKEGVIPDGFSLSRLDSEGTKVVDLTAYVPIMPHIAKFAPELNKAAKKMVVPAAQAVNTEAYEKMVQEFKKGGVK